MGDNVPWLDNSVVAETIRSPATKVVPQNPINGRQQPRAWHNHEDIQGPARNTSVHCSA